MFKLKLDIKSKKPGLTGRLSNFTEREFVFDGIQCRSIEGVLQSLKFSTVAEQRIVCGLYSGQAKNAGGLQDWKTDQTLYWQGVAYQRESEEYLVLIRRLFRAVYDQCPDFRKDVRLSRHYRLDHSIGGSDPQETVLTKEEFLLMLEELSRLDP